MWFAPAIFFLNTTDFKKVVVGCLYACGITIFFEDLKLIYLLWISLAVVATLSATALLHNASHRSFRPKWLNRPMGELMCLFQLTGFPDWTVIHVLHHAHSDDPELDPHPPGNKTYWVYLNTVRQTILRVFINHYFRIFGNNETSIKAVKRFGLSMKVDHFMKVAFWYLLLGPVLFSFFFFPSIVFKMMNHAWLNHSTHQWDGEQTQLVNFNNGLYKLGNFFGFGIYNHKNHHLSPGLFDPRNLRMNVSVDKEKSVA